MHETCVPSDSKTKIYEIRFCREYIDNNIFHDYRIVMAGINIGIAISLFDYGHLVLSHTLFISAANAGANAHLLGGEFSSAANGQTTWQAFSHNAAISPVPSRVIFPIFASMMGLFSFVG